MEECLRLGEIYGNVARGFLGYRIIVFLADPRDVEVILNSNVHLMKSNDYRFFKPWLGDGECVCVSALLELHLENILYEFYLLIPSKRFANQPR